MAEYPTEKVVDMARRLLTDAELDAWLEEPEGTVARALEREGDPLGKAVRTGRLMTRCELHDSLITTARRHSTPAQQMVMDLLKRLDRQ